MSSKAERAERTWTEVLGILTMPKSNYQISKTAVPEVLLGDRSVALLSAN